MKELRNLIAKEVKKALKEDVNSIAEPSEQILKGFQKVLKLKTGINAQITLDKIKGNAIYYEADLSKEIKTPVMQAIFNSLTLRVSCTEIPNVIGGYAFNFYIEWTHPQGGSNGKQIGAIFYQNNKFTPRIFK
jgi:hypothetical protein